MCALARASAAGEDAGRTRVARPCKTRRNAATREPRNPRRRAAHRINRPPPHVHGKEGVDGSSPSEGLESPCKSAFSVACAECWVRGGRPADGNTPICRAFRCRRCGLHGLSAAARSHRGRTPAQCGGCARSAIDLGDRRSCRLDSGVLSAGDPADGKVTVTDRPPSSRGWALAVPPWTAAIDATMVSELAKDAQIPPGPAQSGQSRPHRRKPNRRRRAPRPGRGSRRNHHRRASRPSLGHLLGLLPRPRRTALGSHPQPSKYRQQQRLTAQPCSNQPGVRKAKEPASRLFLPVGELAWASLSRART
jgi:hypothetical protein